MNIIFYFFYSVYFLALSWAGSKTRYTCSSQRRLKLALDSVELSLRASVHFESIGIEENCLVGYLA